MIKQELTYWVTLALMPKLFTRRKMELYVYCYNHIPQLSIIDLFENISLWDEMGMTQEEKDAFTEAKNTLANNSFLIEEMYAQGYEIFPATDSRYPDKLKKNLKFNAPLVIYTKGNNLLLNDDSIAIVGSRNANDNSLLFTDSVAKKAVKEGNTVVSGFAKGVDQRALTATLEAGGKSIIVLPQGIMTFASGFKLYYKYICQGRVLVISTFAPRAPWSKAFAMARNSIIYGMASKIYVAQSDESGGTWFGVTEGLRKDRSIFIRVPEPSEKCANLQLIQKGGKPVDCEGEELELPVEMLKTPEQREKEKFESDVIEILKKRGSATLKDLRGIIKIDWSEGKFKNSLVAISQVELYKEKNKNRYRIKGTSEVNSLWP